MKNGAAQKARAQRLWRMYQITPYQWDAMYDLQKGLCAICQRPIFRFDNPQGKRAANTDHDHKTLRVRCLCCHVCNRERIGMNTVETAKRVVQILSSKFDGRTIL